MKARINITLKPSVLDPQGKAIESALASLGFEGAREVRQGKVIEMEVDAADEAAARARAEEMCRALLANPVMENFTVEILS
ncbi:MAG: phosphoribosylformylglycinamidine synthase subunit PurS [Parvularculaceae bacterium]